MVQALESELKGSRAQIVMMFEGLVAEMMAK
jgi:hypothetical protein